MLALVDEIAYIAAWEDAGIPIDWTHYSFEHQKLTVIWRETERTIERTQAFRLQQYIKARMQAPTL